MQAVVAVIGGIATVLAAIMGGYWVKSAARSAQKASPYDQLAKRTTDLEKADEAKGKRIAALGEEVSTLRQSDARKGLEIIHLRSNLRILGEHTIALHDWMDAGMPPPPPAITVEVAEVVRQLRSNLATEHVHDPATD